MFFHTFRLQVLSPSRTSEVSHSHLLSLEISFRPFRSPEVPEILINLSEIGSLKLCKISGIFSAPWGSVKSSTKWAQLAHFLRPQFIVKTNNDWFQFFFNIE
uniref:Uncharacterized protein orf101-c-1 n=1 Tax=Zea mays subsp. mays TaxID=381124 RepID=Q1KKJ3_MAIZE|nr:hypothetical protein [Zea mays subsp. mays]WCH63090.1 hypothetical protein [Zea mays subsp. mays]WCH63111.1 hypothetical protein [Zea mays subsp. mays]WCH63137.1 hypothetical protein [Zea mays subsp. mays]WCH63158.1 hypothetical protein [Zea mays subsp. mays]